MPEMISKESPKNILFPELSYKLMHLVYEVHNQLGPGFPEAIYERALYLELENNGIGYAQQVPVEIFYKNCKLGNFRLDLVVDNRIIVEIKAVNELNDLFRQQLLSYLKATDYQLGILINFGNTKVQSIRIARTLNR